MNEVTRQEIDAFREAFTQGMKSIKRACEIYVSVIDRDGAQGKECFLENFPSIPRGAWNRFEKIGRGVLHEGLSCAASTVCNRLEEFPYSEQSQILERGIEVLANDGTQFISKVDNLTHEQIKQCFAKGHIRDLSEQKAWIESKKIRKSISASSKPIQGYEIKNGKVFILTPMSFTQRDLLRILGDLA